MEKEVKSQEVKKPESNKKRSYAVLALIAALLLAIGWGVYGFINTDSKSDEVAKLEEKISQIQQATTSSNQKTTTETESQPTASSAPAAKASPAVTKTIVVFEPGGLFSETLRTELQTKLTKPYIAYNQDESVNPVSIHVTSPDVSPGEWNVFVINDDGSYSSFSYGNDGLATQAWWFPECINGPCNFTSTFKTAYPEVVTAANK